MRDNFVFFRSFYEAIEQLGDKSQLKLYKAIMKMNFNCCENMTEMEQLCNEIETELKQNRNVFAQFLLLKPHLLNSAKQHFKGVLGGAPKGNKNALKNNPKEKEKEEEKEKNIPPIIPQGDVKVCEENFDKKPCIKTDPFTNPLIDKCFDIYRDNCGNLPKLRFEPRNSQIREQLNNFLNEIDEDVGYFTELCQKANDLKQICNRTIDFKMLIKNHIGIFNGKYTNNNDVFDYEEYLKQHGNDS